MSRFQWSALSKQQVGAYAEYFVKMELTMQGLNIYTPEVDDRGIDFVARLRPGRFIEIQVKSVRLGTKAPSGYVFMQKTKFLPDEYLHLALVLLKDGEEPRLYLIPSTVWRAPGSIFVDRPYMGLKSKPEWGVNISRRNMNGLAEYSFESTIAKIMNETASN
jgi:hypothetical protein